MTSSNQVRGIFILTGFFCASFREVRNTYAVPFGGSSLQPLECGESSGVERDMTVTTVLGPIEVNHLQSEVDLGPFKGELLR